LLFWNHDFSLISWLWQQGGRGYDAYDLVRIPVISVRWRSHSHWEHSGIWASLIKKATWLHDGVPKRSSLRLAGSQSSSDSIFWLMPCWT
jgi:hypothetical protein